MIVCFVNQNDRIRAQAVKYGLSFAWMLLYIFVIIIVGKLNYYTPSPQNCPNLDCAAVTTWIRIELLAWLSIVVSNITFLAVRFCFKHKIDMDLFISERTKLPSIDTLTALTIIANKFHNDFVPSIVTIFLVWAPNSHMLDEDY